jgi:putative restriction endonuclease
MTKEQKLTQYIHSFSRLRTDRTGRWAEATRSQAPHKPFLLLAVLDGFAQASTHTNLIELTPELAQAFAAYWAKVMSPERRGNLALPFFHLRSSGFWHLIPRPGQEAALQANRQVDSLSQLNRLVLGACLDEDLFELLQAPEPREALRAVLVETYFAPEQHAALLALGELHLQAFAYSQRLVEAARRQVKEGPEEGAYPQAVRDQGFRRAVVRIYEHRCALCGVRMLTADGHTAVDAAHIIPRRVSHDDDPHNGLALCGLCHWTFDQGLLGISPKYLVLLSGELRGTLNVPGHLQTLEGRLLLGPAEQALWPRLEALDWHRRNVFRRG